MAWQASKSILSDSRWSEKQEHKRTFSDARIRNKLRFDLLGHHINSIRNPHGVKLVTEDEENTIKIINSLIDKLKKEWSKNTKELGFNVKPYTCTSCNKRSDKEHLMYSRHDNQIVNLCYKCYKRFNDD